jgi:hypothetical protein
MQLIGIKLMTGYQDAPCRAPAAYEYLYIISPRGTPYSSELGFGICVTVLCWRRTDGTQAKFAKLISTGRTRPQAENGSTTPPHPQRRTIRRLLAVPHTERHLSEETARASTRRDPICHTEALKELESLQAVSYKA